MTRPAPRRRHTPTALAICTLALAGAAAQAQALNALGTSGGLAIPDAGALGEGSIVFGFGNAREPQLGPRDRPRSATLGVGLLPGLDLVGRFAEYATRVPDTPWSGGNAVDGVSDLSANLKFSFAPGFGNGLRLAAGVQDVLGEGTRFRAGYLVATQTLDRFDLSLGVGRSRAEVYAPGTPRALDGPFGGVSWRMPLDAAAGQLTLAAEHDGRQLLAGTRWTSPPIDGFARARVQAALHRTVANGATLPGATAWTLGLLLPLGDNERRLVDEVAPATRPAASGTTAAVAASSAARLAALRQALIGVGLEHVRVGRIAGPHWVVVYQNRRFAHNEADALGLVLGLAAELAPAEVPSITVVALKQGQPVLTLRTDAQAWREFLRDGGTAGARAATQMQRGDGLGDEPVDWINDQPGPATWLQLQITPELAYTLGTEVGAFDHSLALRLLATVPLWRGAQLVASTQQLVDTSRNAGPDGVFADLRQPEGLQALALQQSLWIGEHALLSAAVGRFEYEAQGAEGEAQFFVPGRDDVLRVRGRQLEVLPDMPRGANLSQALSYRWVASPSTWLELGAQRYNDASSGPTAVLSRWWGDVAMHLFYRRGGQRQFAGIEFSFPLTPRSAPVLAGVQLGGSPSWRRGLRTRITDSNTAFNYVEPRRVRELQFAWDPDVQTMNAGRLGIEYVASQFPRMRQAFQLYAPESAPTP